MVMASCGPVHYLHGFWALHRLVRYSSIVLLASKKATPGALPRKRERTLTNLIPFSLCPKMIRMPPFNSLSQLFLLFSSSPRSHRLQPRNSFLLSSDCMLLALSLCCCLDGNSSTSKFQHCLSILQ